MNSKTVEQEAIWFQSPLGEVVKETNLVISGEGNDGFNPLSGKW